MRARGLELDLSALAGIQRLAWSPDGTRLVPEYVPKGGPEVAINVSHIAIVDPAKGALRPVVTWRGVSRGADWSPDSQAISFASMGPIDPDVRFYENPIRLYTLHLDAKTAQEVEALPVLRYLSTSWWNSAGDGLLYEYEDRSRSALYRLLLSGGSPQRVLAGNEYFSGFHFDRTRRRAACLRQSFTIPPATALVDVDSGAYRVLTDLNPGFREMQLVEGRELHWNNRHGHPTYGSLMLPRGRRAGSRRPC